MSWDPVIVAVTSPPTCRYIAWSPCSRFIAVGPGSCTTETRILDAATLKRVKSLSSQKSLTQSLNFSPGGRLLARLSRSPAMLTIWDLQTGVLASIISPEQVERERHYPEGSSYHPEQEEDPQVIASITYSRCETMFGVLFRCGDIADIITYGVLSSTSIGRCSVKMPFANVIWTHNKHIRFATFVSGSITIWELGFTLEHPAMEVGSLPIPNFDPFKSFLFLPTISRLSFCFEHGIFVWDTQHSKLLLSAVGTGRYNSMTFSSDGCFFACSTIGREFCIWKDSSMGYTLHQKLTAAIGPVDLHLSPDGRLIIASNSVDLQLLHTTTPLSSAPVQAIWETGPFVLGFSPDESLAAVAMSLGNTVTVLNLRSGVPQLTINAGMKIYGLRVAERTVAVVGEGKIITWDLPQGDRALNVTLNTNDSIRTTIFNHSVYPHMIIHAAISSDFSRIVIADMTVEEPRGHINIYDMTIGKHLAGIRSEGWPPWFTPDGSEVWCSVRGGAEGWAIVMDRESNLLNMKSLGPPRHQQEGCPWISPCGYETTDSWILNSNGKRLLWLPPRWRLGKKDRVWGGRFLAILRLGLPEAVILELLED